MLIDLCIVEYNTNAAGKDICYAPWNVVKVGDAVETPFGRGTVTEIRDVSDTNEVFNLLRKVYSIDPIITRLVPVVVEELKNDLPEE